MLDARYSILDHRIFISIEGCIEIKHLGKDRTTGYVTEYPESSIEYQIFIL
jgi:hypothetical protein